jgi:hypothetical protein
LMSALETAGAAEIYIVHPDLRTQVGLDPFGVRRLGCRYILARWLPQWAELRSALARAAIRIDDAPAYGELRVGLVFGDRNGTTFEIYSGDLPMPDGRVKGYVQRREVGISASFAEALHAFAEAHPNLARVDRRSPHLCEGASAEPAGS